MGVSWPAACVAYGILLFCAVAAAHVRFERKGSTPWGTLDWSHVARGVGRCSAAMLASYRLSVAIFVCVIDYLLYYNTKGMSRLIGGELVFATFTVWCWTLSGLYFAVAGVISLCDAFGWQPREYRSVRVLCRIA